MKQSLSLNASSFSASPEIAYIVWNLKFHYYLHKSLAFVSPLSQINEVHTHVTSFFKV